jgi:hypothetical protein
MSSFPGTGGVLVGPHHAAVDLGVPVQRPGSIRLEAVGLGRPTDRPDGAWLARERSLAAKAIPDADHPWRTDRSIWQRRTPEPTAERTAGRDR